MGEAHVQVRAAVATGRDDAIDALRGCCIVSMVVSHLAAGGWMDAATHPSRWVDGASGFVLLSGLLVGIVQRRTVEARGLRAGQRKLIKRAAVIYLGHLWLCAFAFGLAAIDPVGAERLPSIEDQGGPLQALLRMLTLQINPYFASILSMYVVLLLLAVVYVALLARVGAASLVATSAGLLIFGLLAPEWSALPRESGVAGPIVLASWQSLFAIGLLAGWYWRSATLRRWSTSRGLLIASGLLAAAAAALSATWTSFVTVPGAITLVERSFDKDGMGPGRIAVSVVSFFFLYRLLAGGRRLRFVALATAPLATVGRRSLDSYVLLSTIVLVAPSAPGLRGASGREQVLVVAAVLLLCWAWALIRRRRLTEWVPSTSRKDRSAVT